MSENKLSHKMELAERLADGLHELLDVEFSEKLAKHIDTFARQEDASTGATYAGVIAYLAMNHAMDAMGGPEDLRYSAAALAALGSSTLLLKMTRQYFNACENEDKGMAFYHVFDKDHVMIGAVQAFDQAEAEKEALHMFDGYETVERQ